MNRLMKGLSCDSNMTRCYLPLFNLPIHINMKVSTWFQHDGTPLQNNYVAKNVSFNIFKYKLILNAK